MADGPEAMGLGQLVSSCLRGMCKGSWVWYERSGAAEMMHVEAAHGHFTVGSGSDGCNDVKGTNKVLWRYGLRIYIVEGGAMAKTGYYIEL